MSLIKFKENFFLTLIHMDNFINSKHYVKYFVYIVCIDACNAPLNKVPLLSPF